MIRSVGPVGFGTRPSDSIESLFRDYLWINFRDPGNLTRYFYDWVAHGYMDYQLGWHSVGNHWLSNRLVYQLGPTVANTAPQPQRIGLLLPRATFDLFDGTIYHEYLGWDWMLHAAKLPYTRIDERVVRAGGLKRAGPRGADSARRPRDGRDAGREIAQWVADGGLLIASGVPGKMDEYGRPLSQVAAGRRAGCGARRHDERGRGRHAADDHIPRGIFSGGWADRTPTASRRSRSSSPLKAEVLAKYESGKPAIVLEQARQGPGGDDRLSLRRRGRGRGAHEHRLLSHLHRRSSASRSLSARTAWLRTFLVEQLGFQPEYGVEYADVERFHGKEADAMGLCVPKGFSQKPGEWFHVRTVGDPRPDHEIELQHETPDMAIRFFPRQPAGAGDDLPGHFDARGALHQPARRGQHAPRAAHLPLPHQQSAGSRPSGTWPATCRSASSATRRACGSTSRCPAGTS